jgi:hypothetical protein
MKARRAIVAIDHTWLVLGFHLFLMEHNPPVATKPFYVFVVIQGQSPQGLLVKSTRTASETFTFEGAEVLIPWEFVKGIVWHDKLSGTSEVIGFRPPDVA